MHCLGSYSFTTSNVLDSSFYTVLLVRPHSNIGLCPYYTHLAKMDLKSIISTPLEAGTSLLDAHRLPSYLVPALEYTSERLAAKGLHITLVVARRDYQLPDHEDKDKDSTSVNDNVPITNLPSPPCSPALPSPLPHTPGISAIKPLTRTASQASLRDKKKLDPKQPLQRSKTWAISRKPKFAAALFDGGLVSPRLRRSHATETKTPRTPATPATATSYTTTFSAAAAAATGYYAGSSPHDLGIRLIHTTILGPRATKLVASTLARASRKFNLSSTLTAHEAATYNIPAIVLHGSILQNEVLHSSEGLTLLSLDHLYTFKCALTHYAATRADPGSHFRLEDAVDELRRYVLSGAAGRRRLLKSILVQAYDWLGPVNDVALGEVMRMYSRAYGGATEMGVEDDLVKEPLCPTVTPPPVMTTAQAMILKTSTAQDAKLREVVPTPRSSPIRSPATASTVVSSTFVREHNSRQKIPLSGQEWVAEDCLPAEEEEGMFDVPSAPPVHSPKKKTPVLCDMETAVERVLNVVVEGGSSKATEEPATAEEIPVMPQHMPPEPTSPPPPIPTTSPHKRISPRPSLPSLRLQTNFDSTTPKPKPRRRKTPTPLTATRNSPIREETTPRPRQPTPISSISLEKDIQIEISLDDLESDSESVLTEFEDADLTARSPVARTPGGTSFWLGIDEILGAGGGATRQHQQKQRRSSSLLSPATPAVEKLGPMTPNGYEDISPTTRGEWGFLMVSDPFRAKTAAVSCV